MRSSGSAAPPSPAEAPATGPASASASLPRSYGGVTVIHGTFANGAPLFAIPNFVRANRLTATDLPRRPDRPADGSRPKPFPATSIVWLKEA